MPRTEHLSNIAPNRIYALDAQVLYKHSAGRTTTAIIEQENSQAKIKIPNSLMNDEDPIEEGAKYHFAFCYIGKNGWISVRHPETSIQSLEENNREGVQPMHLSQIANNSVNLAGHYLTTLLYVVCANPSQSTVKEGKNLTFSILNCFSNGYTVDVTLWNSDLPIEQFNGKWLIFSGFRLKKLVDWKFVLVSSVYSKIAPFNEAPQSMPYNPTQKYYSLSSVFQPRSIIELMKVSLENEKCYSTVEALIKNIEVFEYEGCSECKKKLFDPEAPCPCNLASKATLYRILKITLTDQLNNQIVASVFDSESQELLKRLNGPAVAKLNIKTLRKIVQGQKIASHIAYKISF